MPLAAQSVRGRLVDQQTGTPVAGAFVTLYDSSGTRLNAVLGGADGRFRIDAPRAGRFTVQVERLGYRTFFSETFTLGDAAVVMEFRMPEQAIVLEALAAEATRKCTGRRDLAAAAATIWEELRKALSVASWTARTAQVRYEIVEYHRELDPATMRVRLEKMKVDEINTSRSPFESVPAASLLENGFIQPEGDSWLYYAPDADVLLDDAFLDAHCFRAVTDRSDPNRVGLAFEPAAKSSGHAVTGTLWLDRRTFELDRIDYHYHSLPWPVSTRNTGGSVFFRRLPSGLWIVDAWWLRAPLVSQMERRNGLSPPYISGYTELRREVIATFAPGGVRIPYEARRH